MTGVGAAVAGIGVFVSSGLAYRYGRRATVSIRAEAHLTQTGAALVTARPSIRAVGIFPVRFRREGGAVVRTTEIWADDDGELHDGRFWEQDDVYGETYVYAEAGEEVATTIVFPLGVPSPLVVGWRVSVVIRAPERRIFPEASVGWTDRVFVPMPTR